MLELLRSADAILHAGDINSQAVVDKLSSFAPMYVVRDNNDKDWAEAIPHDLTVILEGVQFYMVHNKKNVPAALTGADVVVFGHSPKYSEEQHGDVLWLNPGSCGAATACWRYTATAGTPSCGSMCRRCSGPICPGCSALV